MSDDPMNPPRSSPPYFRPALFIIGLLVGLGVLAWMGRATADRSHYRDFVRYFPAISPEGSYYPTVDEICAMVRGKCRPDQVLVIIGGNSILNGVGQPAEKLWSLELQRLLGDEYCVVNLALRGAHITDGGAVIAEVLRDEFPRQIYVANTAPFNDPPQIGGETYRYLFWEAYFRELLIEYEPRDQAVEDWFQNQSDFSNLFELAVTAQVDRVLRFRDLWNRVAFETLFTVHSRYTPSGSLSTAPRGALPDQELDLEKMPFDSPHRFADHKTELEMPIVRAFSGNHYERSETGVWKLMDHVRNGFLRSAAVAFPDGLKARTLVLLSRNSPYYLQMLSPEEMKREDVAYNDAVSLWKEAGYEAMEYGRDFSKEGFGDRTHLTADGGLKLASLTAPKIRSMSANLGFKEGGAR